MVLSQSSTGDEIYSLVYSESVLTMNKDDRLMFLIQEEKNLLDFQLIFSFDDEGDAFSTTFWETPEKHILVYALHKWESPTWVEISKPIRLKGNDLKGEFFLKFRSHCSGGTSHRKFDVTVWKLNKVASNG